MMVEGSVDREAGLETVRASLGFGSVILFLALVCILWVF